MEKRNLTEYLSPETVERLTGEAFQEPAAPKRRRAGPALALAASLAIIAMAVNPAPVYAAVRGLLYFLPGSGGTTQLPPADYWLPEEEYSYEGDGVSYFLRNSTPSRKMQLPSAPRRTTRRRRCSPGWPGRPLLQPRRSSGPTKSP